ncbi:hypothetical protein C8J98_110121 [Luteibacter sp. OK325]|uniref:hypothetical protein n=1 Tax=Luteibacter sp. OK325 TaxID=2135670 RepID=UPI000D3DBF4A|nr:hypothetical protein [Luteibacter sp. OK325]PTR26391.1 hypothetical protein C8J98_110121 [Luteibacter sp. OK325]
MLKPLPALALVSLLTFAGAGMVFAGNSGAAPSLPGCHGGSATGDACLLSLKNGHFDDRALSSWERVGLPGHGTDAEGNTYAALPLGSSIQQAVYAHTPQGSAEAVYTLRFQIRAEHAPAQVRATLSMSTGQRTDLIPLGHVTSMALTDQWSTVELSVQGRPYAAPAHVLVAIDNEGGTLATVQVDDVVLIESAGTEVFRR